MPAGVTVADGLPTIGWGQRNTRNRAMKNAGACQSALGLKIGRGTGACSPACPQRFRHGLTRSSGLCKVAMAIRASHMFEPVTVPA